METAFRPLVDIRPTLALAPNLTSFVSRDITLLSAAVQPMVDVRSALTSPPVVLKGSSLSLPFSTSFQEIHSALNALPSAATLLTQLDLGLSGLSFLALPFIADMGLLSEVLPGDSWFGDVISSLNTSLVNIPALIFPALKSFGERFRQRILAAFERAKLFLAPSIVQRQ